MPQYKIEILYGGAKKFFGTLICFFRSFISFFRSFISRLRGESSFAPWSFPISSVEKRFEVRGLREPYFLISILLLQISFLYLCHSSAL